MNVETRTHTALHIMKGAIVKALGEGAAWTSGVSVQGSHGRITVQFNRKPTDDEVHRIQRLANEKVREDQPVEVHTMARAEAEARWGNHIYDLFPLPEHITELQVFHLPGWNVNACNKEHTPSTGGVGELVITKARFRNKKQLLEVSFDLVG